MRDLLTPKRRDLAGHGAPTTNVTAVGPTVLDATIVTAAAGFRVWALGEGKNDTDEETKRNRAVWEYGGTSGKSALVQRGQDRIEAATLTLLLVVSFSQ